ncbi:MAG: hypothetical protein ABUT39_05310 [Acidobacteriota bacterium]
MIDVSRLVLSDFRAELVRNIKALAGACSLEEAFAAWLVGDAIPDLSLIEVARAARQREGAQRTYRDVATLGFALMEGDGSAETQAALRAGLLWVSGRQPFFEGSPAGFEQDPIALLGISLGARRQESSVAEAVRSWLSTFIERSYNLMAPESWERAIVALVQQLIGALPSLPLSEGDGVAEIRVALRAKGLLESENSSLVERDEAAALVTVRSGAPDNAPQTALRLAALDWIRRISPIVVPGRVAASDLVTLLQRVPAGLARWTWESTPRTRGGTARQWHVDNEYQVQNLLWFLLSPIFPDLRAEEYAPPVGHRQPRVDIGVPALRVIVEVKFMRPEKSFSDITEEIASDASLYLTPDSRYTEMVVFIWDEARKTEQYDRLRSGLKQIRGVTDAVIIPRPGGMY